MATSQDPDEIVLLEGMAIVYDVRAWLVPIEKISSEGAQ
jgi:hypothetical protein